ncbi:AlpA family phage regulatory protein [bacterium AH-315-O15]|nr:AlpA family phage regulatory protein [bacterium AH-315-O15]
MTITSQLLRPRDVATYLGISSTTLWRIATRDTSFPPKYHIGANSVGWRAVDVDKWLSTRRAA